MHMRLCEARGGEIILEGKRIGKDIDYPPSLGLILEVPGFLPNFSGLFNLEMLQGINYRVDKAYLKKDDGASGDSQRT